MELKEVVTRYLSLASVRSISRETAEAHDYISIFMIISSHIASLLIILNVKALFE